MTKEQFLTVSWNNRLSLILGLPTLIFALAFLSTSFLSDFTGFLVMVFLGVVYWLVVEFHSNMRFAWLRKKSGDAVPPRLRTSHPLNMVYLAYNAVYWVPIILTFARVIDYRTGFIAFFMVILVRSAANLARNNIIRPEIAEAFPLRS